MRKSKNYYIYRSVFFSVQAYVLVIAILAFNSITAPTAEEEEGVFFEVEDLPVIKPEIPLSKEILDNMNADERRNYAVNKALNEQEETDPYDYSDVEKADDKYKESLVKKALSESEYKKIFERDDLNIEENNNISDNEKNSSQETQKEKPSNFQGATYISYFIKDRYKLKIPVPTYKCESSGTVKIHIEVNRSGKVSYTEIDSQSTTNTCLREAAIESVKSSKFNENYDAPLKQQGTITYIFEAQ